MNLDEAKSIVLHEADERRVFRCIQAAAVLCAPENADTVSLADLLKCMKRGNNSRKLKQLSEYAAIALYSRTGREKRQNVNPYDDLITDADDWHCYLKERRFV
jgi:hypothetical protein